MFTTDTKLGIRHELKAERPQSGTNRCDFRVYLLDLLLAGVVQPHPVLYRH
jgi:hypothetical protein